MAIPPKETPAPNGRPAEPPRPRGDIALDALAHRRPLSPPEIHALSLLYKDVVLADDDEAKTLTRRIVTRLRRAGHDELHPGCERVVVDVPQLPSGHYVTINDRQFVGPCEMWACEAQTVLGLVWHARAVETARLRDDGRIIDLDREALAARAQLIRSA
jgi:hypothetical protein